MAALVDDLRRLDLVGIEIAGPVGGQVLGQDKQTVERGAQFMGHIGQKLGFIFAGYLKVFSLCFHLLPGFLQFPVFLEQLFLALLQVT